VSSRTKILIGVAAVAVASGTTAGALAATHTGGKSSAPQAAGGRAIAFGFGFGFGGPGMHGPGDKLAAAATYLGISTDQLMTQLQSGKTLAQIASSASGKSTDGLVAALVAAETKQLDAAVAAGKLTKDQENQILPNLQQRITNLVNGTLPKPPLGGARGFGARSGGSTTIKFA
jgi:hypothetical protein